MKNLDQIYKFVDEIAPKMYLDGWEIELRQASQNCESGACAEMKSRNQYREATMTIYPNFFDEAQDKQQKIIIHELCHIITSIQNGLIQCAKSGAFINDPEVSYAFEEETTWVANIINKLYGVKTRRHKGSK